MAAGVSPETFLSEMDRIGLAAARLPYKNGEGDPRQLSNYVLCLNSNSVAQRTKMFFFFLQGLVCVSFRVFIVLIVRFLAPRAVSHD